MDPQNPTISTDLTRSMHHAKTELSRALPVQYLHMMFCMCLIFLWDQQNLKQRKPSCERVMYLYICVHCMDPEVRLVRAILASSFGDPVFSISHHLPWLLLLVAYAGGVLWELPTVFGCDRL